MAAPLDVDTVAHLVTLRMKHLEGVTVGDPHEPPRERTIQWDTTHLEMEAADFTVWLRVPRRLEENHINYEELAAIVAFAKWCLRSRRRFGHRLLLCVDSLVALSVVQRGRAHSQRLAVLMRRFCSLSLAGNLWIGAQYVPSE